MKAFDFIKLYIPLITFIGLIILFFIFDRKDEELYSISFSNLGMSLKIPINSFVLKKSIILIFSIASLSTYIFYDYSDFFPKRLIMEVFFDKEGINNMLTIFTEEECNSLHIVSRNITEYQSDYYHLINSEAIKLLRSEFFTFNRTDVHSEGATSFIVEKIRGIQNYYLKESEGILKHLLERPKSQKKEYCTFFEKISSSSDKITPSLKDIFIKNKVILKPRFKQIISINSKLGGKVFDHVLHGYTVINIFPYPRHSNTLYLLELDKVGLIPIGYAVYR